MSSISVNAAVQPPAPGLPTIKTRPRLSIVLISVGPVSLLDSALKMVLETHFYLETELLVVRTSVSEEERAYLFRLSLQHGFMLELAPVGANRDMLADLGSQRVSGDIVTVKDDHVILDDLWLSPFASPVEQAAWDSGVARTGSDLLDRPVGGVAKPVGAAPVADLVASAPRQQGASRRRPETAPELNA